MGLFSRLFSGRRDTPELPTCIACDSQDLDALAPAVYRCRACGYEGGDGYTAWLAQKQHAALGAKPTAELRARTVRLLRDIELATSSVTGDASIDGTLSAGGVALDVGLSLMVGGARGGIMAGIAAETAAGARQAAADVMLQVTRDTDQVRELLVTLEHRGEGHPATLAALTALQAGGSAQPTALAYQVFATTGVGHLAGHGWG